MTLVALLPWLGLLWLAASAAGSAQPPRILLQFSHVAAPDTVKGKSALLFKQLGEQRTGGRVKIDVYPNSQLYKDREELQALQLGAVQMLAVSLSKLAGLGVSDFELFGLPFLFKDLAAFRAVADGPLGAALFTQLESKGIRGLAYWNNGFQIMSANKPLRTLADFQGVRMRTQSSRVLVAQMQALGAVPKVTLFSEQYAALKAGRIDGGENVPSNFYTQQLDDVQRYLTLSNHSLLAYAVIVNKAFWDGLPEDIRSALESALRDATAASNERAAIDNARAIELIQARGKTRVDRLTRQQLAEWKQALKRVHEQAQAWISAPTLRAARAAAGFVPFD